MKFLIAILTIVGTKSLWEVDAGFYTFDELTRLATESPDNDYVSISIPKAKDGDPTITFKQDVDTLFFNVTITYRDTGDIVYSGGPVDVCSKNYEEGSWERFSKRLLENTVIPIIRRRGRKRMEQCPIKQGVYVIYNTPLGTVGTNLNDTLQKGQYDASFTGESPDHELVLSVTFEMKLTTTDTDYKRS